jgi:hypothetical protein
MDPRRLDLRLRGLHLRLQATPVRDGRVKGG